jgi:hypothetical protein
VRLHDLPPATVADALTRRTVPELRALAALIGSPELQRKPELVGALERFLRKPTNLRSELEHMDELERAAVAEAVREPDGRLQPARFRAKYGRVPGRGSASRLGCSSSAREKRSQPTCATASSPSRPSRRPRRCRAARTCPYLDPTPASSRSG